MVAKPVWELPVQDSRHKKRDFYEQQKEPTGKEKKKKNRENFMVLWMIN
jgi:hypothetical protein